MLLQHIWIHLIWWWWESEKNPNILVSLEWSKQHCWIYWEHKVHFMTPQGHRTRPGWKKNRYHQLLPRGIRGGRSWENPGKGSLRKQEGKEWGCLSGCQGQGKERCQSCQLCFPCWSWRKCIKQNPWEWGDPQLYNREKKATHHSAGLPCIRHCHVFCDMCTENLWHLHLERLTQTPDIYSQCTLISRTQCPCSLEFSLHC